MSKYSVLETDPNILKQLTDLVSRWLEDRNKRASAAKSWKRFKDKYWWNYFLVDGIWWGFNVYDDEKVKRIV